MTEPMTAEEARDSADMMVAAGDPFNKHIAATLRAYADMLDSQSGDVREAVRKEVCRAALIAVRTKPEYDKQIDNITNTILALTQPAVKVKALEWSLAGEMDAPEHKQIFNGSTTLGCSYIVTYSKSSSEWLVRSLDGQIIFDAPTLDAAKAAAQAHYNDAISKAVKPVPDGWGVFPLEPTNTQLDSALHEIGSPNPKESKTWLRAFYRAMLSAAPTGGER